MSVAVLASHLGYDRTGPKSAVVRLDEAGGIPEVALVAEDGTRIPLVASAAEQVDAWSGGAYARVEFDDITTAGRYRLEATAGGERAESAPFAIGDDRLIGSTLSDVLAYFRAMRSSGEIDRKDAAALLQGDDSGRTVDASGGWLDASGDPSKFLSHLSYTPMMSPQQIPVVVWGLLAARDRLREHDPRFAAILGAALRDEALHGADFLTRFRAPEGHFYLGIFDALTKRLDERVVNAPLPECVRTDRYQASFRAGGGMAVAALARASREAEHGDVDSAGYLDAAITAFDDLLAHNGDYLFGLDLDTGELTPSAESIVDDYCALLAASELYAATGTERFAEAARDRAARLLARYRDEGWFVGAQDGRPFFHAVEPGLPVLALLRFAEVVPDSAAAQGAAVRIMSDVLARTDAVANPFGYPRQRARWTTGEERDTFFFPHANDTGYWWQGENAGISSLSAAASQVADVPGCPADLAARLRRFAADQLQWILGRNPFDVCMLQGRGHGNVEYAVEFPNLPGGIVNGITSGVDDEHDIGFLPPGTSHHDHSWRWAEQWIPHTAWFALAMASASGPRT
ncbi:glycoside hydrolase family 9 protein [Microbacterium tumbae]